MSQGEQKAKEETPVPELNGGEATTTSPEAAPAEETTPPKETSPSEPKVTEEPKKKKRKQRKPKKVELDEEGNPIQKKKRKLNHQCAAVKICHALMQEYRSKLGEEDQSHLAKFCQLNRGDQGIMFNKMCVTMRTHLKDKFPELEKWEDMDFEEEEKRPDYVKVVNFLLDDYMDLKRKELKEASETKKETEDEKTEENASAVES